MINTTVSDACVRLLRQFNIESRHDGSVLEPLQDGDPYTPANASEIADAVAAWRPFHLSADRTTILADGVTAATITVRCAADVPSVALWIGAVAHTVQLSAGVGAVQIVREVATLPPHIIVKAQDQSVFGYAQITIVAE